MSNFEVVDADIKGYYDILIEVGFKEVLYPKDIISVLQIVIEATTSKFAMNIFEGLGCLEINSRSLTIRFRRLHITTSKANQEEDINMQKMRFMFYLFARIDAEYTLADTPFGFDFRQFLDLPNDVSEI